jgi:hypothetical protein
VWNNTTKSYQLGKGPLPHSLLYIYFLISPGILEQNIELKFTPSLKNTAYNLSIASDTVITLTLNPGKKWANPSTVDGMTL